MQKIYLCSFGDIRLNVSSFKFYQNALDLDIFDDIFIYNETNLNLDFKDKMKDKIYLESKIGGGGE